MRDPGGPRRLLHESHQSLKSVSNKHKVQAAGWIAWAPLCTGDRNNVWCCLPTGRTYQQQEGLPQDCAEKPLPFLRGQGRNDCLGPKEYCRNDGLQWQSRSYHAIMHQVHTTWGKLPSGSFQLVLVMHTCTDLFYLC